MNNNCNFISAYLELSPDVQKEDDLNTHLKICKQCSIAFRFIENEIGLLHDDPALIPESGLETRIVERINDYKSAPPSLWLQIAASIIVILVGSFIGLFSSSSFQHAKMHNEEMAKIFAADLYQSPSSIENPFIVYLEEKK